MLWIYRLDKYRTILLEVLRTTNFTIYSYSEYLLTTPHSNHRTLTRLLVRTVIRICDSDCIMRIKHSVDEHFSGNKGKLREKYLHI